MDFGFGLSSNPFDFGGMSFATGQGTPVISGGQSSTVPAGTPWWQSLTTFGLDGFKSWLNYDLAQQQVAKGQYPSQNASGVLLGGSVGNYGSLITWALVIGAILLVFRAVGGKR